MRLSFLFLFEDLPIRCLYLGLCNVLLLQLLLRWLRRLLLRCLLFLSVQEPLKASGVILQHGY
jgi:hypothetical protein